MITLSELNSQLQVLSALVVKQAARIADLEGLAATNKELTATVEGLETLVAKQAALIQHYEAQLLYLKRRQFGQTSERTLMDGQINFLSNMLGKADVVLPPTLVIEEITYKRKKRIGKREEDLSNLPVVRVTYELPEGERNCPSCETSMRDIGVTIRREIEIIPAQAIVKEHATHAYACSNLKCEGTRGSDVNITNTNTNNTNNTNKINNITITNTNAGSKNTYHTSKDAISDNILGGSQVIIRANSPKPLISGSLASPSLVAHIAYQKYSNGMPLYRIEKGFKYDGVVISRQNMSNWVIKCSQIYLASIYERLKRHLLQESVLHSDATTIQVLREEGRAATTKSCQWVYRTSGISDKKIVVYEYTQTKGQEHPKKFLADFTGYLHADGASVYHKLPPDITIVGCWAHARRYFESIVKSLPEDKRKDSDAAIGLGFINTLFKLERDYVNSLNYTKQGIPKPNDIDEHKDNHKSNDIKNKDLSDNISAKKRYLARLEKSKPISDAFFEWAYNLNPLPQSPLGKAINYALSQRKYLENIFLDGRLELSNNRCERSIKPFVIGRKAWLFSNTPEGAEASSMMYSIIETAKENGLHPFYYIKFLLETLPNSTYGDLEALLPWSDTLPDWCRVVGDSKKDQ